MTINKISNAAAMPEVKNGIIELKAIDIITEVGRDGRVIIGYKTGLEVLLSDGEIGFIYMPDRAAGNSLYPAAGTQVVKPGDSGELIVRYKTNTDAIPSVFDKDDVCAVLYVTKIISPDVEIVDKTKELEGDKSEVL